MAPRAARRTPAGPGSKRAARGRAMTRVKVQLNSQESNVKAEEEEEEIEVKEEVTIMEEQPLVAVDKESKKEFDPEEKIEVQENTDANANKDEDSKEPDDYERNERLDFDDNNPEYEPEEDDGVDYDGKVLEQDPQEVRDEVEEEPEEADVGEEEDSDLVEYVEDIPEELEPEEADELGVQGHTDMVIGEEEHHEGFKERRKRKEFEIFVGGLDKNATENDLVKVFSEVGEVTEVRLMMNPQTRKKKGFAFLRFATVEQAKRACTQLKNPVVHGKQCGVTPSQDSDTLFLGNICRTWTKEALKEKLKHYGVENIEDLTLVEDNNNIGIHRGFAFLEFSSRSDAMDAFKHLQRRDIVFGVDRPAKVSFADSFFDPGDEIMSQVKTVFVDGISASWDEDHVKELLKLYGKIEKIELARNMPSARRRDYGFVTFDTHDAAVTCAKSINNEELGDGDNKSKVRARLSRPLQRGKGKHVTHGDVRHMWGSTQAIRSVGGRLIPHNAPLRGLREAGPRLPPVVNRGFKRSANIRDRRPVMTVPPRSRPVAPLPRSYDRRPPVPYPKIGFRRDYSHHEEPNPRSRAAMDYSFRVPSDRHASYRDDYFPRGSGYPGLRRDDASRPTARRAYIDDGYSQRYEKPPPTYREDHGRGYDDSMSGSKRPYATLDDAPRYAEMGLCHTRVRLDYDLSSTAAHYTDAYGESRLRRSNLGYGGSRTSLSNQKYNGLYSDHPGMGYSEGPRGGNNISGMYASSAGDDYMSRGSDVGEVGGSSYSSLYSGHGVGGNSYMGSGGSGSYY